jgi:Pretoxin HINT domain
MFMYGAQNAAPKAEFVAKTAATTAVGLAAAPAIAATGGGLLAQGCGSGAAEGVVAATGTNSWWSAATGAAVSTGLGCVSGGIASKWATKALPCASFRADTLVLMADGSKKPIGEIELGDKVIATDPVTGKTSVREVTRLFTHIDDDLLDLIVLTDDGVETIHTTDHHRFWNDTRKAWVEAKDLQGGERLLTWDRDLVTVGELKRVPGAVPMLDLTVEYDHTFYVALNGTAVLVHNQTCPLVQLADDMASGASASSKNGFTRAGHALSKHAAGQRGAGSAFPLLSGNPAAINATAQGVLDDILTTGVRQSMTGGRFAGGYKVVAPDGRFAVYDNSGVFQYFGE